MLKITATLCSCALAFSGASAAITFSAGTTAYNDSDVVFTPSASLTATNSNNFFFRETRAAMQTFVVTEAIEIAALSTIVRRAVDGATFTLHLIDLGAAAPANFYTPEGVAAGTNLASSNISITSVTAFGQSTGGIDAVLDPYTTMTWTLPSSVTLVTGRTYAFVLDGTSADPGNIVMQYGLGNPYAGGLGYMQIESGAPGPSPNFRSGNDYFGGGNNQQADWGLALVAIPEPSTYAVFAGLAVLGLVMVRRRLRK
ncbi:MAG: PEP-CTERM sorting domain-containing protein [Verrucomicrobia bacterium]|nr:PEP-CTERM sorting domain-containing protein [Verrucomicrobiota bacterium]